MRLGLLDVGSTAARLEMVDLDRSRMPRATWSFKARTRLAEHTKPDGVVTEEGIDHAVRAVRECVRAGQGRMPRSVVAFGTSAVRDAANGAELRRQLGEAAGVPIGALTPHGEAGLTYHAARRWHGVNRTTLTTVDIGGGTLDVATGTGAYPDDVVSLPFGAAALTRQYLPDDPPKQDQVEALRAAIRDTLPDALGRYGQMDLGHTVAQSKVLRQLAVLAASSDERLVRHPDRLVQANLQRWIPRLSLLDQKQRKALPGVSRSRARRILAGAMVADGTLDAIGVDTAEICPWGLREGLIFRFVEAYECAEEPTRRDAVRAVAYRMFHDDESNLTSGPGEQ